MISKEEFEYLCGLVHDDQQKESLQRTFDRELFSNIKCPKCDKLPEHISSVSSCLEHMVIIVSHSPYGVCRISEWMVAVLPFDSMKKSPINVIQNKGSV